MPDVVIRNDTPDRLNVAFRFVAPAAWTNSLDPGNTWTAHLASVPYTIEVRLDQPNNQFSTADSWATAGDIVGGWAAGAASVTVGTLGMTLGGISGGVAGATAAGPLMEHAVAAGARFSKNASGMVITVGGVWIPFFNKTYAVRFDENSGYSLWDADRNYKL